MRRCGGIVSADGRGMPANDAVVALVWVAWGACRSARLPRGGKSTSPRPLLSVG